MHALIEQLLTEGTVLTDGSWGTQLQARGLDSGACPDEWNLSHPERVEEVPRAYLTAGSRVVLTNTFRANRVTLASYGLGHRTTEINRAGVEISRRAVGTRARVFGSIGPSGKMLISGEVSPQELREAFDEQARALAQAGADALVIETMAELEEADLAMTAARQTGLPVVACMVFDTGPQLDCTMMGVTLEQAARHLTAAGVDVVGANCGQGIEGYARICRRLRAATDRPLWIKPNAGTPKLVQGQVIYETTPEQFASNVPGLIEAGASFVGGCCGTGPEFIRALTRKLVP
jgi:methionine synthase I (cobalamin-dependent)